MRIFATRFSERLFRHVCEFRQLTLASRDAARSSNFFREKKRNRATVAAINWMDDCEATKSEQKVRRVKEDARESPLDEWIRLHSWWFALHLICMSINWPQLPENLWCRGCSCHHNPRRDTPFSVSSSIVDEKLLTLPWCPSATYIKFIQQSKRSQKKLHLFHILSATEIFSPFKQR